MRIERFADTDKCASYSTIQYETDGRPSKSVEALLGVRPGGTLCNVLATARRPEGIFAPFLKKTVGGGDDEIVLVLSLFSMPPKSIGGFKFRPKGSVVVTDSSSSSSAAGVALSGSKRPRESPGATTKEPRKKCK